MTAVAEIGDLVLSPYGGSIPTGEMGTNTFGAMVFNAAGDQVAFLFQAQSATAIDGLHFQCTSVTSAGTAGDVEATLEELSAGLPNGAVTNSATGTLTVNSTGRKIITGMAGTATLTVGKKYAIVLTAGAGWDRNLNIGIGAMFSNSSLAFPSYVSKDSGGAWTRPASVPGLGFALGAIDASANKIRMPGWFGAYNSVAAQTFGSGTNPDERGNRFVLTTPKRLKGVIVQSAFGSTPDANDDHQIFAYSDPTTAINQEASSTSLEGESQIAGNAGAITHLIILDTPYSCAAGEEIGITMRALGTGGPGIMRWDYPDNAETEFLLGTGFYAITRNDASGNATGDTDSVYAVWPVFDQGDDGSGSGGATTGGPLVGRRLAG